MLTLQTRPAEPGVCDTTLGHLESWLRGMRGPDGYGGPVAHWWRDSLQFAGAGLDWRYEGIVAGYLELFERTGEELWLEAARAACDDLLRGQLPSANFRHSGFEQNPCTAGTPHEAAADIALLSLAKALRVRGRAGWEPYLQAASNNLRRFYFETLWNDGEQRFRDDPAQPTFVANKTATLIEALCLWAELAGTEDVARPYVRASAAAILAHQVVAPGNPLDGAIAQNTIGGRRVDKYFPYYVARCVPGLLVAWRWLDDARYAEAACRAATFVFRWRDRDGGFPQVVYPHGRANRYPRWIAACGDILRVASLVRSLGVELDEEATRGWLLRQQLPSGAFPTAHGFGSHSSQKRPSARPDWRDLLPVCGWNDKAFRYLAGLGEVHRSGACQSVYERPCTFYGQDAFFREDAEAFQVRSGGRVVWSWTKGHRWAQFDSCAEAV